MRVRDKAIVGLVAVIAAILVISNQNNIRLNDSALYWVQVFSGNWSPDYGRQEGAEKHYLEFFAGSLIALILNLGTISALLFAIMRITIDQVGAAVIIKDAFDAKDDIFIRRMESFLHSADADHLIPELQTVLSETNNEWETGFLRKFLRPSAYRIFMALINKPVSHVAESVSE
ncbi:hypothetical protein [Methylorubrum sp. SB2]|uniref:hypothetical protein n=1 Tax=Methylorubrum subtropicum TaxID=3138812 RepID=UPI00313B1467